MKSIKKTLVVLTSIFALVSCSQNSNQNSVEIDKNEKEIRKTLEVLLTSIENKNIDGLKSTMSPSGQLELIQPNTKTTNTVDEFVQLHDEWFKDTTWAMDTKILNIETGLLIGTATTEAIYKETNRNGKPYFNHMIVTYVLKKETDNKWYVIKDHASSLKKSTD